MEKLKLKRTCTNITYIRQRHKQYREEKCGTIFTLLTQTLDSTTSLLH